MNAAAVLGMALKIKRAAGPELEAAGEIAGAAAQLAPAPLPEWARAVCERVAKRHALPPAFVLALAGATSRGDSDYATGSRAGLLGAPVDWYGGVEPGATAGELADRYVLARVAGAADAVGAQLAALRKVDGGGLGGALAAWAGDDREAAALVVGLYFLNLVRGLHVDD